LFPRFNAQAGLPSKEDTKLVAYAQIAKENIFPVAQAGNLFCPESIYNPVKELWEKIAAGDFKDIKIRVLKENSWEIRRYVHESLSKGDIEIFCRWDGLKVIFGFYWLPFEDETPECEVLGDDNPEKLKEEEYFLRQVWTEAPKVETIRAEKKISLNDPCPCGRKKPDGVTPVKYKNCCGF
jgi:hypothetical protein